MNAVTSFTESESVGLGSTSTTTSTPELDSLDIADVLPASAIDRVSTDRPELSVLAAEIRRAHQASEADLRSAVAHARCCGQALLAAKQLVPYGAWGRWVADHCPFTERTAQNYMRLAEADPKRVSDLSVRDALATLAADRAPLALAPGGAATAAPAVLTPSPAPDRYVTTVPIRLAIAEQQAFTADVETLRSFYGTATQSATVTEAISREAGRARGEHVVRVERYDEPALGSWLNDRHWDVLLTGGRVQRGHDVSDVRSRTRVLKPDGSPLAVLLHEALPRDRCERAFEALRDVPLASVNRGMASGGRRHRRQLADGSAVRTTEAPNVPSGIFGFYDRDGGRTPYCRMTALTAREFAAYEAARPLVTSLSQAFAREVPDRFTAQAAAVAQTSADFIIPDTVFTTVTVNRNWQTALHRDEGDLAEGFGVLTVLPAGEYTGGLLVFPAFRLAVDLRAGQLLLADVHEAHGQHAAGRRRH